MYSAVIATMSLHGPLFPFSGLTFGLIGFGLLAVEGLLLIYVLSRGDPDQETPDASERLTSRPTSETEASAQAGSEPESQRMPFPANDGITRARLIVHDGQTRRTALTRAATAHEVPPGTLETSMEVMQARSRV